MDDADSPRVLVIDDRAEKRYLTKRALDREGIDVLEAEDGEQGLRLVAQHMPDLVILDVRMPSMDGFEVLRRLKQDPLTSGMPVLLLSATDVDDDHKVRGLEGGAAGYLATPEPAVLVATVKMLLVAGRAARDRERLLRAEQEARLEARALEQRFRSLVAASSQVVWTTDAHGAAREPSPSWGEYTGQSDEQWRSRGWLGGVHPDDVARAASVWSAARQSARAFDIECRIRRADGSYAVMQNRGIPLLEEEGSVREWVGTLTDISDRRRGERELRLQARVLQSMSEGVSVSDEQGYIVFTNAAEDEMFGYEPGELIGRHVTVQNAYPPEENVRVVGEVIAQLKSQGVWEGEWQNVKKDGAVFLTRSYITALDLDGQPHWICVQKDITEQRRQEREAQRRAEFESQLVGMVSHDLRNPMHAILLAAATLERREGLDERTQRGLTRIVSAAERAVRLIHDLLDFTQARVGPGIAISPSATDLHAVVHQVVEEHRQTHPKREIRVFQRGEGGGLWDADRLAQVVGNLLSNALKYSPEETPVALEITADAERVDLSVHNWGAEIPADKLPALFQPFQRGSWSGTRAGRSIGLGLFIVASIVDAHQGAIEVTSSGSQGTRFLVRLPRHRVPSLADAV